MDKEQIQKDVANVDSQIEATGKIFGVNKYVVYAIALMALLGVFAVLSGKF